MKAGDDALERRRLAQRLGMLRMILASYWIDAGLLALFWAAGAMAPDGALIAGVGGTAACALFRVGYVRGWSDPWRDRNLALPQALTATVIQLSIAYRVPEATLLVLTVLFIVFAVAALRLEWRHIAVVWLLSATVITFVVVLSPGRLSLPAATPAQSALSAVWLALVLGRCAVVGLYGSALRRKLGQRTRELDAATEKLEVLATRDGLTGALNRRAIVQVLECSLAGGGGEGRTAALLVDMDHFKSVNDVHGHAVGDEVLRRFVFLAASVLRTSDRLGRYGGEEFLVVLPAVSDTAAALAIAERLCSTVAAEEWEALAPGLRVTASIGVAVARDGEHAEALVTRADGALYRAKRDGRNGVHLAS